MRASIKGDARQLQKALQLYSQATKKEEPEILNRAARNFVIQVTKLTPKAVAAKIREELTNNQLAIKILNARGRFKGVPYSQRGAIIKKFINARVRSAAYIAGAGWAIARKVFSTRAGKVNPKSEAAKGYGIKATIRNLEAVLTNNAVGVEKVGAEPARQAFRNVAKDMAGEAKRRLQKAADKHSAK